MNAHLRPTGSAYFISPETAAIENHTLFRFSVDSEPGTFLPVSSACFPAAVTYRKPDGVGDRAPGASVALSPS